MTEAVIIWGALALGFVIVEVVTMAFVAVYLALGAMAAGIVAASGLGPTWQLLAFAVTTGVLMLLTRPVLKKRLESPDVLTNVNRMIGKGGIVTIAIDNDMNTGQIRVGTEYWTARLPEGSEAASVPVDAKVRVLSVEGVTARVELV